MIALLFALYAVSVMAMAPGGGNSVADPVMGEFYPQYGPPSWFALSRSGTFARTRADGLRTELRFPDALAGRSTIPLPSWPTLRKAFATWSGDNSAGLEKMVLAGDGTPFVTMARVFNGAYIGTEEHAFYWQGAGWRNVTGGMPVPYDASNLTIGAADSPDRFVCNENFASDVVDLEKFDRDPHYMEQRVLLADRGRLMRLGYGTATAMSGSFVSGFTAGLNAFGIGAPRAVSALEWNGVRERQLGRGMAYAVNARGVAAGDDRATYGGAGKPTLWDGTKTVRLSDSNGTAFGIGDDGTIVGQAGPRGFVIRGSDRKRTILPLETLLDEPGWRITSAYAVAKTGRILAIGYKRDGVVRVLLLDPKS